MVRRARLCAASGPDRRGAAPRQLSTVPAASATRIVFHRAGDAETEEPTVQQLAGGARANLRLASPAPSGAVTKTRWSIPPLVRVARRRIGTYLPRIPFQSPRSKRDTPTTPSK